MSDECGEHYEQEPGAEGDEGMSQPCDHGATHGGTSSDAGEVPPGPDEDRAPEGPGDDASGGGWPWTLRQAVNRGVLSTLVIRYPQRDIHVALDDESALRVLSMLERRAHHGLGHGPEPSEATADSGWALLGLREPLALSWLTRAEQPRRTVVDPPVVA